MTEALDRFLSQLFGPERGYAVFRLLAYVFVSACALVADVTVYVMVLGHTSTAAIAAAFGFVAGVATHYVVSSRLVFADRLTARGGVVEAPIVARFFIAGATGLMVTPAIVWLIADVAGYHPYVAKAVAVVVSFASVLTVMRLLVLGNFLTREPDALPRSPDHVHRKLPA